MCPNLLHVLPLSKVYQWNNFWWLVCQRGNIFNQLINNFQSFGNFSAQKIKFPIKDFFSKCHQTGRKLRIWSHLMKKSLMQNFIFCGVCSEEKAKDFNRRHKLRKKCSHLEFFWSVLSAIRTEYGDLQSKPPYSVRMWEKTYQKNSEYEHFSYSNIKDPRKYLRRSTSLKISPS